MQLLQRKYMNTSFMSSLLQSIENAAIRNLLKCLFGHLIITSNVTSFFHISAEDEEIGEIPVAFVVKKVGSVLSPKDVVDYVAEQVFLLIGHTWVLWYLNWYYYLNQCHAFHILTLYLFIFSSGRLLHTRKSGRCSSPTRYQGLRLGRSSESNSSTAWLLNSEAFF